jgi:thiamine biosynthesis lipoprotein
MTRALALVALAAAVALSAGCTPTDDPYVRSDDLLGTAISVTVYADSEEAAQRAATEAFERMGVATALDAYDPASPVAEFNADPFEWNALGELAAEMAEVVSSLDPAIAGAFDYRMWGVSALYDFGGEGRVPDAAELDEALLTRDSYESTPAAASSAGPETLHRFSYDPEGAVPDPGLDFGGLAKGHALDLAAAGLEPEDPAGDSREDAPTGAIVTAVSTTLAIGEKPGGEPWRVGIEDPREPGRVIAVAERDTGPLIVSTSGDYQQYFDAEGVRYHHILDPVTGTPARGLRSLTVAATDLSATEADILSTALFVLGLERAEEYAEEHGFALYVVDDQGATHVTPGPESSGVRLEETAEPTP